MVRRRSRIGPEEEEMLDEQEGLTLWCIGHYAAMGNSVCWMCESNKAGFLMDDGSLICKRCYIKHYKSFEAVNDYAAIEDRI